MPATVTLYSAPWCGYCRIAKRFLDEQQVPYTGAQVVQERPQQDEQHELHQRVGHRLPERLEPLGRGQALVEEIQEPEEEHEERRAADAMEDRHQPGQRQVERA